LTSKAETMSGKGKLKFKPNIKSLFKFQSVADDSVQESFSDLLPTTKFASKVSLEDLVPVNQRKELENRVISPSLPVALEKKTIEYSNEMGDFHYSGEVLEGTQIPHGSGTMTYPNGTYYEGEFGHGKRLGFGKLFYNSTDGKKASWVVIGDWVKGLPRISSQFKITHANNYEYWGDIEINPKKNNVEVLDIEDFHKTGQGELYCRASNERYFGSFANNMKNGFGVQVFSNRNRYFGGWKDDQFHGEGTLIFFDGTMFQGTFQNNVRKGKGTMFWPNGDCLSGDWNGSSVNNATFTKGTCKNCSPSILYQMEQEISNELRTELNAGYMTRKYGLAEETIKPSHSVKWKQFKIIREETAREEQQLLAGEFCSKLKSVEDFKECLTILLEGKKGCDESQLYFKSVLDFFVSLFNGSYYSNSAKAQMKNYELIMHYAIEDFKSILTFLDSEVWEFFNLLFEEMIEYSKDPQTRTNKTSNRFKVVLKSDLTEKELLSLQKECRRVCEMFIANFLHRKLYDSFFALYETTYQEKDLLINQKLDSLHDCVPEQLGVPPIFLPSSKGTELPYSRCIALLDSMAQKKNVSEKIEVLSSFRESLFFEIRKYRAQNRKIEKEKQNGYSEEDALEDENWQPGADDATPVMTYIFIKCQIRNHHAQFKYINDWKDESVSFQPVSHAITFYEGFLSFIEDLDPSLKNSNEVYISIYSMTKELERAIDRVIYNSNLADIQKSYFNWIPLILVFISLEVGRRSGRAIKLIRIPTTTHAKLITSIIQNYKIVEKIISESKLLGFTVILQNDSVFVDMEHVLPTHVYSDIAFQITKFIHFELER
jgi:hypothetical protein